MTEAQRRWATKPVRCVCCNVDVPQAHLKRHNGSKSHQRLARRVLVADEMFESFLTRVQYRHLRGWEQQAYRMALGKAAA